MLKTFTFTISAENHPDLLARTVMLFHRMAVPIYGLTMQRPMDRSNMRMVIAVLADPSKSERITVSLGKIVQVLSVDTRKRVARPAGSMVPTLVETP
jgi:acetolactate synthase small subunit